MSFLTTVRQSLLAREVTSLWVAEGLVLGLALVQAAVVARELGPEDFGTAALVVASTSLIFTFLDPQSQEAVVKYLGANQATGRTEQALAVPRVAYGADLLLGLAGFLIVTGGSHWVADHVIRSSGVVHLLIVYAGALTFAAPSATSRAVLTTFRRFTSIAVLQGGAAVLRTTLAIVLVTAGRGVSGVVYASAISVVLESICAAVLAQRALRSTLGGSWWQARRAALGQQFKEMVRFMLYTDLTSLVTVFVKEADLVVLGYVRGPTEAGYYRVARLVGAPLASIALPLQRVVYPRIAVMAGEGDESGMRRSARRYTLKVGIPIAAGVLAAIPLVPFAVPVVAGTEYRPAVDAAIVLLIGGALILPTFWVRPILLSGGHVRFLLKLSAVAAVLTFVGYFALGELMGDVGVALSRAGVAGVAGSLAAVLYFFRRQVLESRP